MHNTPIYQNSYMYITEVNFFISLYIPKFTSINPMYQNSASFQARFHTAQRDDKGLAMSITTWWQKKVKAEAEHEECAGVDDVEAGDESAARDEGEARDAKALTGDKKGDGATAVDEIWSAVYLGVCPR